MSENHTKTDFGFKEIPFGDKTEAVKGIFRSVAKKYDIMNDLMSAGLHRLWKDHFVGKLRVPENATILDLAGGTGDISFRIYKKHPTAHITLTDINEAMLGEGRKRAIDQGYISRLEYALVNAEEIPFDDNSFDAVTIAFGIRNVTDKPKALAEILRVLKPNGQFLCLEFAPVETPIVKEIYDAFSFHVIPKIGKLVTQDEASYQYLVESIRMFPKPENFKQMILDAGFASATFETLNLGVVAIHTGWKRAV